ncbi:MAG: hypothetical protein QOH21_1471 [Acidobacteriota bacterium]|nr:hypothetical protein [Acidobacteriota bacterium]
MRVAIQTQGLTENDPSLSAIVLGLSYTDSARSYYAAEWFLLTADRPSTTWQFDPGEATSGTVFYEGVMVSPSGDVTSIPAAALEGSTLVVGTGVAATLTVAIVPLLVDWTEVAAVVVDIAGQKAKLTVQTLVRFVVVPAAPYDWSAVYTLADGTTYSTPSARTASPILLLPSLPPRVAVTFAIDAVDFGELPIASVALTVDAPGAVPILNTFIPGGPASFTTKLFETPSGIGRWSLAYGYRYTVTYTNGLPDFVSAPFTGVTATSVMLEEVGIRMFALATLSPIITSATVNYLNGSTPASRALPVTLVAGNGDYTPGEAFRYAVTFAISGMAPGATTAQSGSYVQQGPPQPPAYTLVPNPLQSKSVTVTATGISGKQSVQLSPSSIETGNLGLPASMQWSIAGEVPSDPVNLTPRQPAFTYTFEAAHPDLAALNYPGTLVMSSFVPFTNAVTVATGNTVSPAALPFTIQLDPTMIDWTSATAVAVTIWSDSDPSASQTFPFTTASGYQYFTFTYPASGEQSTFGYKATYSLMGGGTSTASGDRQSGTTLLIPRAGD